MINDFERFVSNGSPEVNLQGSPLLDLVGHGCVEGAEAVSASRFGGIKREVGVVGELGRRGPVSGRPRQTDNCADLGHVAVDEKRVR